MVTAIFALIALSPIIAIAFIIMLVKIANRPINCRYYDKWRMGRSFDK